MGTEATITLDKPEKKAKKVQGADAITSPPDNYETAYEFVVKTQDKEGLAGGCPAYICINGRWYKI